MCIPCEALVGNLVCSANTNSSCEMYDNTVCGDTNTCLCNDDYYDGGTTCLKSKI